MRATPTWRGLESPYNPLGLMPGDVIEIGFGEVTTYTAETLSWYRTAPGDPDFVRYGLRDMVCRKFVLLDIVPRGPNPADGVVTALLELGDEMPIDDRLLQVMDDEPSLRRTVSDGSKERVLDYLKDFVTEARVEVASESRHQSTAVASYSYFRELDEGGEEFLIVDVDLDACWMRFYVGRPVMQSDLFVLGTAN